MAMIEIAVMSQHLFPHLARQHRQPREIMVAIPLDVLDAERGTGG